MVGACFLDGSCASGTVPAPAPPLGRHWCAPPGLLKSSHSKLNRFQKKLLLHLVGVLVQMPSRPLVIASPPLPVPKEFFQPKPCCSSGAPSGSGPQLESRAAAMGSGFPLGPCGFT